MKQKQRPPRPCTPTLGESDESNEGQALKAAADKLAAADRAVARALSQDSETYLETQRQHGGQ